MIVADGELKRGIIMLVLGIEIDPFEGQHADQGIISENGGIPEPIQ